MIQHSIMSRARSMLAQTRQRICIQFEHCHQHTTWRKFERIQSDDGVTVVISFSFIYIYILLRTHSGSSSSWLYFGQIESEHITTSLHFYAIASVFFPKNYKKKKYTKMHFVNQRASRCFSPCDQLQTTRIRLSLSVSPTPFVLVSLFSHKICFSLHSLLVPSFRAHATRCRTAFIAIRQIENAHAHNPRLMPTDAQLNEITHQ